MQDMSNMLGPNGPSGRTNAGARPKNSFKVRPTAGLSAKALLPSINGVPDLVYTCTAELTISKTRVLLTQSPWSGGSPENWLPPPEYRLSKWFSPSNRLVTPLVLDVTGTE